MSAAEAAAAFVGAWREDSPRFGMINFANADMVGHTGVIPAAVTAIETVDAGLGEVVAAVQRAAARCVVTADHGNADHMLEPDGSPEHGPLAEPGAADRHRAGPGRCGRAACWPTSRRRSCEILGVDQPEAMTGHSLIT